MTHDQALSACAERNREAPAGRHWFVKQTAPQEYEPVCIDVPGTRPRGALGEMTEARPEPPTPGDPRSSLMRDVPGYGA